MRWDDDSCGHLWELAYQTGRLVFPQQAAVLEIGCAEFDWITPLLAVRPDLHVTGIDWRAMDRSSGAVYIQGDVLSQEFPAESFDVIVGISSIEHIGLGHYEHDPSDEDGDRHCMERVVQWLKHGGWCYADMPYGPQYGVDGTSHRIYDDAAVTSRLLVPGLKEQHRWIHESDPTWPYQYVAFYAVKG